MRHYDNYAKGWSLDCMAAYRSFVSSLRATIYYLAELMVNCRFAIYYVLLLICLKSYWLDDCKVSIFASLFLRDYNAYNFYSYNSAIFVCHWFKCSLLFSCSPYLLCIIAVYCISFTLLDDSYTFCLSYSSSSACWFIY